MAAGGARPELAKTTLLSDKTTLFIDRFLAHRPFLGHKEHRDRVFVRRLGSQSILLFFAHAHTPLATVPFAPCFV